MRNTRKGNRIADFLRRLTEFLLVLPSRVSDCHRVLRVCACVGKDTCLYCRCTAKTEVEPLERSEGCEDVIVAVAKEFEVVKMSFVAGFDVCDKSLSIVNYLPIPPVLHTVHTLIPYDVSSFVFLDCCFLIGISSLLPSPHHPSPPPQVLLPRPAQTAPRL